jgi:hypothetical protein
VRAPPPSEHIAISLSKFPGTTKAASHLCFSGSSMREALQALFYSRRVCGRPPASHDCYSQLPSRADTALIPSTHASGSWDSIHVFEGAERGRAAHYKLTSTVILQLVSTSKEEGDDSKDKSASPSSFKSPGAGSVDLSGSMTRQVRSSKLFALEFIPTSHSEYR